MEIRLGGDMRQRPIRFFAAHRFEHDTQTKAGGRSGQEKTGDDRFEQDIVRRQLATNLWRHLGPPIRLTLPVSPEGIHRPGPRRRKIELPIPGIRRPCHKRFTASVLPQIVGRAGQHGRRQAQLRAPLQMIGKTQVAGRRSVGTHADRQTRGRLATGMTKEGMK